MPDTPSRIGRFIQNYHNFLSTFVIGAAGLIATSIWQYKQSEIVRRQAESQQAIAETQADNQWRIKRAEILGQNLQVLASRGAASAEDRYGVLLSLTRGELLDPELAVAYSLELGEDNPDYMKSVLASTADKNYDQLAHAFALTCAQRYGLARQVDLCKNDAKALRSQAIAELVGDEAEAWAVSPAAEGGARARGPLDPLADEDRVVKDPARFAWLYAPALAALIQKGQWAELRRIETFSDGAHLVAALVVLRARTGDVDASGDDPIEKIHAAERAWLAGHLVGRTCDDDCRARVVDAMLTGLGDADDDYDEILRGLLERPLADSGAALEKLQTRFLRCQVADGDGFAFRDRVLVPAFGDVLAGAKPDAALLAELAALLAVVPEPSDPVAQAAWSAVLARYARLSPDKYKTEFVDARFPAEAQRRFPPTSLRGVTFCNAPEVKDDVLVP